MLAGSGWGIHPLQLKRIYIAMIRSRIDYASFLYDTSASTHLTKLDVVQNICLRIIGGFIKSTPVHVMESELVLPPLLVRRQYLAGKFFLRSKSFSDNSLTGLLDNLSKLTHLPYWKNKKMPILVDLRNSLEPTPLHSSNLLEMFSLDTWVTNLDLCNYLKTNVHGIDNAKSKYSRSQMKSVCTDLLSKTYFKSYKLFTDGSKSDFGSGAAFLDWQTKDFMRLRIDSNISIMAIEMIAIVEALSYIECIDYNEFVIFTDSKSAIQHLMRCTYVFRGIPLAYNIIRMIRRLISINKRIVIQWIPSHTGFVGNEEVDRLAKEAALDGVQCQYVPWFTDVLFKIRDKCHDIWSEYFDERSLTKGIWYKTIQPSLPRVPWFSLSGLNRQDLVVAFRLRSGHIPLNSFGYLMRKVESPKCSLCDITEDVYHVTMECGRNEDRRRQLHLRNYNVGMVNSILAIPYSEAAKAVFELVQICFRNRIST